MCRQSACRYIDRRENMRKKWISIICAVIIMVCTIITPAYAAGIFLPEESNTKQAESTDLIEAPSGILMEAQTGTVVYQKDADTRRSPASITKIMTLILIFDALDKGSLKMDDTVTTSAHAKSMGGSQVFLEEGEIQTVETLIKCIVIASGNDASVAMAEHICGSEQEFVRHMNERAEGLGMKNTHFEDCCGLTESPDHYTTARDIAIMSRELITKYPKILEYSSIWMENITHVTRQGTKEFGLTNTNKLIRSYEGCVGLKTGSTSIAKYCLSATAKRNGLNLIAVVMAAPDHKVRFSEAQALLDYGFANCSLYQDDYSGMKFNSPSVRGGIPEKLTVYPKKSFSHTFTAAYDKNKIKKKITYQELKAPIKKGTAVGFITYSYQGKTLGKVPLLAMQDIKKAGYTDYLLMALDRLLMAG